jgi:hypothetical protein
VPTRSSSLCPCWRPRWSAASCAGSPPSWPAPGSWRPSAGLGALLAIRRAGTVRPGIYLVGTTLGGFALERGLHALAGQVDRTGALERLGAADGTFRPGPVVAVVTVYGGIAFVSSRISRSWKVRASTWASAAVAVVLAGAVSVHAGAHGASSAAAAGAVGAAWLAVARTAWAVWDRLGEHPVRRRARDRVVGLTLRWGIVVVSLGVVLHVLLLALPGIRQSASTPDVTGPKTRTDA